MVILIMIRSWQRGKTPSPEDTRGRLSTREIGKILRAVGAAAFLISFVIVVGLGVYFVSFPPTPNPQHGLTAAYNDHGTNHYIPLQLRSAFDWAFEIAFGSFCLLALGVYLINEIKKPPPNSN